MLEAARHADAACDRLFHLIFIERPLELQRAIFTQLIETGMFAPCDVGLAARQFHGPVFLTLNKDMAWEDARAFIKAHLDAFRADHHRKCAHCSQTGFTATYARWLGEELGAEPLAFADRSSASVAEADTVVFLSWFHAGGLKEASWFRKLMDGAPEKRYAVVGVGPTPCRATPGPKVRSTRLSSARSP